MAVPGPTEILAALVAAGAAFLLLEAVIRRTMAGLAVLLGAAAITVGVAFIPELHAGGTRVDPMDAVAVLLLAAGVARLLRARDISTMQWVLIAFGAVVAVSIIQGVVQFGLNQTVNESRQYIWFVSAALYFSTLRPERELFDRIARAWLFFAGFLVALAVFNWTVIGLGLSIPINAYEEEFRVLSASTSLVILQGFLIGAVAWAQGSCPRWVRRLTPVLLAIVVLMQHRSVWAVLIVTVVMGIWLERRLAVKLLPAVMAGLLAVFAISLAVLDQEATELTGQLAESAAYRDTWQWRIEGWHVLVDQSGPRDPMEALIGRPFGGGWDRMLDGQVVVVSPHNFYLETAIRTGVVGLGLLVVLYGMLLWRLVRIRFGHQLLDARTIFLMLLAQPIFFIPYSVTPVQGIIVGLAVAAAAGGLAPPSRESDVALIGAANHG